MRFLNPLPVTFPWLVTSILFRDVSKILIDKKSSYKRYHITVNTIGIAEAKNLALLLGLESLQQVSLKLKF